MRAPDRYNAITARLTAGGHQLPVMRLVAGCILTMALPPLRAATNPDSTRWPGGRGLLIVIVPVCLGLAVPWLRRRWPSRTESITVVVVGALFLAAGCVAASDPLAGLAIATAFAFILGYVGLFHGSRPQWFTAIIAVGTVGWLAGRIAIADLPTALAVTTPVVLVILAVFVGCRTIAAVTAASGERTDVEPLTGLLTRASFDELAATLLGARNRGDDRYLVVAVVGVDNVPALLSVQGRRGVERVRVAIALALRDTVRRGAIVGHVGDDEFLIAEVFTTADPAPLAERIRGAVAATPGGDTASIGVVSTPLGPLAARPPHEVLDEIVALGTAAMWRARGRGGNQADYVLSPVLRGPAEPDPDPDHG